MMTGVKKLFRAKVLTGFCMIIAMVSACTSVPDNAPRLKDGVLYGTTQGNFRHRWWNYYERALSFAEGAFYAEATADLQKAIRLRDMDIRGARTYGYHFIDYFPNRELGIIYYLTKHYNKAKISLERSIQQYPSAKAIFYLDRVRKAIIEQSVVPVSPPTLTLDATTREFRTREDPIVVSGLVEDKHFVSQVVINKTPIPIDGAKQKIRFSEKLHLNQGRHLIPIVAENLAEKSYRIELIIHVDRQGPMIIIDDLSHTLSGDNRLLNGAVYDDSGILNLTVNGSHVPLRHLKDNEASFQFTLPGDTESVDIQAADLLGNQTTSTLKLSDLSVQNETKRMAVVDFTGNVITASLLETVLRKDTVPPVIMLNTLTDMQTVYLETIYMEGQIRDESQVSRLTINNVPILKRAGKFIFFSHMAGLQEGPNLFIIEAEDIHGNHTEKRIIIERKIPQNLLLNERMRVTVLPFKQKGAVSNASFSFQDNLISALFKQKRFQIVERDILDKILKEHKLNELQLDEGSASLARGRINTAGAMITGSIIETHTGIEIVSRMIDTETSETIATEDVYGEERTLSGIKSMAHGMAMKFHIDFPLISGDVLTLTEKGFVFNVGKETLRLNRRVVVFREIPFTHQENGKSFGKRSNIIDHARITQKHDRISTAELVTLKALLRKHQYKIITE